MLDVVGAFEALTASIEVGQPVAVNGADRRHAAE
jgi:hypothetical protein